MALFISASLALCSNASANALSSSSSVAPRLELRRVDPEASSSNRFDDRVLVRVDNRAGWRRDDSDGGFE